MNPNTTEGPSATLPQPTAENGWMRNAALWYAALGFKVHPLEIGGKFPNKHLLGKGWRIDEVGSNSIEQILEWWTAVPAANIGIAQGVRQGTCVIDMDVKRGENPYAELERWQQESGVRIEFGPTCLTGSGGWHHWLRLPPGVEVLRRCHGWRPGIDVQMDGSYVVVPPSHVKVKVGALRSLSDPKPRKGETVPEVIRPYTWVDRSWQPHVPTFDEFTSSLERGTAPVELITDVCNTAVTRLYSRSDLTLADIRDDKVPVPIEEWLETGVPEHMKQNEALWLAAAALPARKHTEEDAKKILWRIAQLTPDKDPGWPWTEDDTDDMVRRSYEGLPELRAKEKEAQEANVPHELAELNREYGAFLNGIQ